MQQYTVYKKLPGMMLTATSLRDNTRRLLIGFGIRLACEGGGGVLGPRCPSHGRIIPRITGCNSREGAMPPFPMMLRFVSGKARNSVTRQKPETMAKNPNIHLQPGPEANAPPMTGPRLGAVVTLTCVNRSWYRLRRCVTIPLTRMKQQIRRHPSHLALRCRR